MRDLHGRVSELWALSTDVFIASAADVPRAYLSSSSPGAAEGFVKLPELRFWAIASSAVPQLVGEEQARDWLEGGYYMMARAGAENAVVAVGVSDVSAERDSETAALVREHAQRMGEDLPVVCDGLLGLLSHAWRELLRAEQRESVRVLRSPSVAASTVLAHVSRKAGSRKRVGRSQTFKCILIVEPDEAKAGSAPTVAEPCVRVCEVKASLMTKGEGGEDMDKALAAAARAPKRRMSLFPTETQPREVMVVVRDVTDTLTPSS
jgi:hypothetical protein